MAQFGEELRREREARGISLEDITKATKVSGRHLAALEREEFAVLPGGVFNKGIVRSYARVVGLDQDAWVERYLSAHHGSGGVMDDDASWTEFANNVHQARSSSRNVAAERLRWAGVLLLLLMMAGAVYLVFRYVKRRQLSESARPAITITSDHDRDASRPSISMTSSARRQQPAIPRVNIAAGPGKGTVCLRLHFAPRRAGLVV